MIISNYTPGSFYAPSGKVNVGMTIVAFLIAIPVSLGFGWCYGFLSELNPFIILDIVIFFVALLVTSFIQKGIVRFGKIRNKIVSFILCFTIGALVIYASWLEILSGDFVYNLLHPKDTIDSIIAYPANVNFTLSKIGRSGGSVPSAVLYVMYFIEFLGFILAFLYGSKDATVPFCEESNTFNEEKTYYYTDTETIQVGLDKRMNGDYSFFKEMKFYADEQSAYNEVESFPIFKVSYSNCPKTKQHALISIEKIRLELDKKNNTVSEKHIQKITKYEYINSKTIDVFEGKTSL